MKAVVEVLISWQLAQMDLEEGRFHRWTKAEAGMVDEN